MMMNACLPHQAIKRFTKISRTANVLVFCLASLFAPAASAATSTLGYWRFETSLGVAHDSGPNQLTLTKGDQSWHGLPLSYALSALGAGSSFPAVITQTTAANVDAVQGGGPDESFTNYFYTTPVSPALDAVSEGFTIECLVSLTSPMPGTGASIIAAQGYAVTGETGWALSVTQEDNARGARHVLFQWDDDGTWGAGTTTVDTNIQLEVGDDYYLAASLDASDPTQDGIVIYYENLTEGTGLQTLKFTHTPGSVYSSSAAVTIGAGASGVAGLSGIVDEVRLSSGQLDPRRLLIAERDPVYAVVAYWRFDDPQAVGVDSGPNGVSLTTPYGNGPLHYALPSLGAGSMFPVVVPQVGSHNTYATQGSEANGSYQNSGYMTEDSEAMLLGRTFTVEAFVNMSSSLSSPACLVAKGGDISTTKNNWALTLTQMGNPRGDHHVLFQYSGDGVWGGSDFHTIDSNIQLTVGHDYYLAVSFNAADTSANGLVFYCQDLTAGTAMQIVPKTHSTTTLYSDDRAVTIGMAYSGIYGFKGIIDEVRLSDYQLSEDELLVSLPGSTYSTAAYWCFDLGIGVTQDLGPNGVTLAAPHGDSPESVLLPSSGAGSAFPMTLPQVGGVNTHAIRGRGPNESFQGGSYMSERSSAVYFADAFTVEALVNLSAPLGNHASLVAKGGDAWSTTNNWSITVTKAGSSRGDHNVLFQLSGDGVWGGAGFQTIDSDIQLTVGHDYYLGIAFNPADTSENGLIFYYQDLTVGGALQVVRKAHAGTAFYTDDTGVSIGASQSGTYGFTGLIDEVRLSDYQLSESELLVSPPEPIFSLSFEDGFTAQSQGQPAPLNGNLPDLVQGISGMGASMAVGDVLEYSAEGNLTKDMGAISLWVQAPVSNNGLDPEDPVLLPTGTRYTLFRENGPNENGSSTLWWWLHVGDSKGLRVDVRDPSGTYSYMPGAAADWQMGEWHHLVFNWNCSGWYQVYVDGRLAHETVLRPWEPQEHASFYIGAYDGQGNYPWGAAIDEVKIFDCPLASGTVRKLYSEYRGNSLKARLLDPYLTAGVSETLQLALTNMGTDSVSWNNITYRVLDDQGQMKQDGALPDQTVAAGEYVSAPLSVLLSEAGSYTLEVSYQTSGASAPESFVQPLTVVSAQENNASSGSNPIWETTINMAVAAPTSQIGGTTVVQSGIGNYREGGTGMNDRFAYTFEVSQVEVPYMAVITYPDDKPRTMEVLVQGLEGYTDYQGQTGVFTGEEYPSSDSMREHSILFWPTVHEQAVVFMTAEEGYPAAASEVKIYRLDHLPVTPQSGTFVGSVPARTIGIYYEDPVLNQNFARSTSQSGFAEAVDRLTDYMHSNGLSVLNYPLVWYYDSYYGSLRAADRPELNGDAARNHPGGFPAYLIKRLAANGMAFNASMHIHRMDVLNRQIIMAAQGVSASSETAVNVRSDGSLWWGYFHGYDPSYNPADPSVMAAVKDAVSEVVDRYGDEPGFQGITLVMARPTLFQFGSIDSGYNDTNLVRFQQDSGVSIPDYAPESSTRFSDASAWLRNNPSAMDAWISWRCQILADHYRAIASDMASTHPGLTLTLNIFRHLSFDARTGAYLEEPSVEVLREAGMDPSLYADTPNIVISYTLVPADARWARSREYGDPADIQDRRTASLAPETMASIEPLPRTGAVIFDRYWEDPIGREYPLSGLSGTTGKGREVGWRVSTFNAAGVNAMEPYVVALNNFDAQDITKGGFVLGTIGMESFLRDFSAHLRALPAVRFYDVPGMEDPVRVRQKVVDGSLYLYALNRLPVPVETQLVLNGVYDVSIPALGETRNGVSTLSLELPAYGLRSCRIGAAGAWVTGGQTIVPSTWVDQLTQTLQAVGSRVVSSPYLDYAQACLNEQKYARLYFLLQEEWAE